jgi:succinoglycan biosynthesis protein ExoA
MPEVSVIVPCYNEEATICMLLDSLSLQTFAGQNIEIIISDGMSTDRTRAEIRAWQEEHKDVNIRIVDNPNKNIPSGLNRAIQSAQGEFLVRLDAHSIPNEDYIEKSVNALKEGRGDNVGGIWRIVPGNDNLIARSIAAAAAHPLGVGGVQYRIGGQAQSVDTVPFGAFHLKLVKRIGLYDETLLSNEDYEYNARIRNEGGVVWFDPEIQSKYISRSTFRDLARQYWRYGYWKFQMLWRYPKTIRLRQGLPPLFLLILLFLIVLSLFFYPAIWILSLVILFYTSALLVAGIQSALKYGSSSMLVGVPFAILVMHFSWGSAFLWSFIKTLICKMEDLF